MAKQWETKTPDIEEVIEFIEEEPEQAIEVAATVAPKYAKRVQMELNSTIIFEKNFDALQNKGVRFVINEGGSRSSKTYSLCQLLIVYALQNPQKVVSIIRKTFPALRATVMRDFFEILKDLEIYSQDRHNKSEHIYTFDNGSIVEFSYSVSSIDFAYAYS